ncbi:hypothetical protein JXD38_10680 [candidate division WOR-3 bacterium]|nr:hypothetical protein [candidate division WOR-3 bacterium]
MPALICFLPLYAGAVARARLANGADSPMKVGLRVPFGAEYVLPIIPLGVFFELAPILDFAPGVGFNGNGAVGVRYDLGPRS